MPKHFYRDQRGAVAIMVALMLPCLLGFGGLALDMGYLYVTKANMQSAVDAAVQGGALALQASQNSQSAAISEARSLLSKNHFDPNDAKIDFNIDAAKNPGKNPEINCMLTKEVPTLFMTAFGYESISVTVSAKAILNSSSSEALNYTLFSDDSISLSGNIKIKGDVHTNGKLTANGNVKISGNAEGSDGITLKGNTKVTGDAIAKNASDIKLKGNSEVKGEKLGGAKPDIIPDYSQQIKDTVSVPYQGYSISGNIDLSGNIYVPHDVSIHGNVDSTGAILADGNITVSGNIGISGSNQICLYSANGNIFISGNFNNSHASSEIIYAPNGYVFISGNNNFNGAIIAKGVSLSGNIKLNGGYSISSLPGSSGTHVKIIQ